MFAVKKRFDDRPCGLVVETISRANRRVTRFTREFFKKFFVELQYSVGFVLRNFGIFERAEFLDEREEPGS